MLLAFGDRDLQERIFAAPLVPLTRETITDPTALRRKLAEVRALGHAVARGFIESVSTGLAVPVRDETGAVAAALSVVLRRDDPVEPALVELHAGKREIERSLGFRG